MDATRRIIPVQGARTAALLSLAICSLLIPPGPASAQNGDETNAALSPGETAGSGGVAPRGQDQTPPALDPRLEEAVIELDSATWIVRHRATETLRDLPVHDDELERVIMQYRLSTEQKHRLLSVLEYRLLHGRGAVGIRMNTLADGPGVTVTEVVPGLPAENVLLAGDFITHVDGARIQKYTEFDSLVKSKRPGQTVTLEFLRPKVDEKGGFLVDEANNRVFEETPRTGTIRLAAVADLGPAELRKYINNVASEVENRLAVLLPPPRQINIPNDRGIDLIEALSGQIDEHPYIREVLRDLDQINNGRLRRSPELRQRWTQRREMLNDLRREATLTNEQRFILFRIIDRYQELAR